MLPSKPWPGLNSQACDHPLNSRIAPPPRNRKSKVERRPLVRKAPFRQWWLLGWALSCTIWALHLGSKLGSGRALSSSWPGLTPKA